MFIGASEPGFLLVDSRLRRVALNDSAAKILTFPGTPERIKRLEVFLTDKICTGLLDHLPANGPRFVTEFKSGRRHYVCRAFPLDYKPNGGRTGIAVLLQRHSSNADALSEVAKQFELTDREREVVQLLLQGLTTKEIASRLKISPNTVKGFLRLVMVKMGVPTRSAIVCRAIGLQLKQER